MPITNSSSTILRSLLRPAVRFALRRGIKVRTVIEELKVLLVEQARAELGRLDEEATLSRLSVMTGLQRRDVQKLSIPVPDPSAQHLDLMTRIVSQWCTHEKFSRGAKPRELSVEGSESDFALLVRSVSLDLNPATILFELERLGLVEQEGPCIRLMWDAYQITGDIDDAYTLLQRDIASLVDSVDSNITQKNLVPNLHISTQFDNVSEEALQKIREWLLQRGAAFHADVREFVGSFDKDINPTRYAEKGGARVVVGSFGLCETPEASDAK
jgi:hypothetical protein